jgi:dienelactone hydrolase
MSDFPPSDPKKFTEWIQSAGDVGKAAMQVEHTRAYLSKECGANVFGVVGFCWGGGVSLHLASALPLSALCDYQFLSKRH